MRDWLAPDLNSVVALQFDPQSVVAQQFDLYSVVGPRSDPCSVVALPIDLDSSDSLLPRDRERSSQLKKPQGVCSLMFAFPSNCTVPKIAATVMRKYAF